MVGALALAITVHRHPRAPLYLGLLGGFVLVIANAFGLWLFLRNVQPFQS